MDSNKENETINIFAEGDDLYFPYDNDDELFWVNANPYDDYFNFDDVPKFFGDEDMQQQQQQPLPPPPPPQPPAYTEEERDENNTSTNEGSESNAEVYNDRKDEEGIEIVPQPVYVFSDGTIQRLFDNNKLIFVNDPEE